MSKVALVTGGTRGVCEALQAAGYTVAANYAGNDAAVRGFTEETGIPAYKFDVGDHQACQDGIAALVADLGDVGILINNAGITRDGTLMNMSHEDWQAVVRVNLGGCFNTCKAVLPPYATIGSAASLISAPSTGRPANTARPTMPLPNRASTASLRPWPRKARVTTSR